MGGNYRALDGIIGAFLAIALMALLLAASVLVPVLRLTALGLLGFQELVIDRGLGAVLRANGVEADLDALPLRLIAMVILYGSLLVIVYILFLAGTHLSTLMVLALGGGGLGLAMMLLRSLHGSGNADLLSGLRFWGDQ